MITCKINCKNRQVDKLPNLTFKKLINSVDKCVLIRSYGNIGDLIMMRMIFEDLKKQSQSHVSFCCTELYLDMIEDHPFLDSCFAWEECGSFDNPKLSESFFIAANLDQACVDYEREHGRDTNKNRSDIWAESFGLNLENHNPHICLTQNELDQADQLLNQQLGTGKKVLISAWTTTGIKNLPDHQVRWIIDDVKKRGMIPFILHNQSVKNFEDIPSLKSKTYRELFSMVACCDYAVSADTGAMHVGGAVGLPTLGIFGHVNHDVMLRYYPNAIGLQLNQSDAEPGMDCVPCYNWSTSCPYLKDQKYPLKCLNDISHESYLKRLDELFTKEHLRSYRIVPQILSCRQTLNQIVNNR